MKGLRRLLTWTKRIVLALMALAFLALAVAVGAVHTDWGRNKIRTTIVAELQADFPGSTIASIDGSPFGTLILRGVTINGRDRRPMVTIERLEVEAQLRPLIRKRVHVDRIALTTVDVFVREQPPKPASTTSATTATAPTEPSAWTIELPSITLDSGRIFVELESGRELVDKLAVKASVHIPSGQPIAASANIRGEWRGKSITASALVATGDTTRIPLAIATLGGANVVASGVELTTSPALTVAGAFHTNVPAGLVEELTGQVLPADIALVARASATGAILATGTVGTAHFDADLVADLTALRARGLVAAEVTDITPFTKQNDRSGAGTVVAAVSADRDRVRGLVTVAGTFEGNAGTTTLAIDATRTHAELVASADAMNATAAAHAVLDGTGTSWMLTSATVHARGSNIEGVRDATVHLSANGPLSPAPQLTFVGTVDAFGIRQKTTSVGSVHVDLDGTATPERQHVSTRVAATRITSGTTRIPFASLISKATIEDGVIDVALGDHEVRTSDGARWRGTGGTVRITDEAIAVNDVRTGTRGSRLTATARMGRLDDSLKAKVTARNVSLAIADPTVSGTADADIDITARGTTYQGTASVRAIGVTLPDRPPVDANLTVALKGRKVTVDGNVTNPEIGTTTVAASLVGPRVITNVRAWQRLPRSAIDNVSLSLADIDGAPLGVTGRVDGQLAVTGTGASGQLRVRGVVTKAGPLDADLTVTPADGGGIHFEASARAPELPPATASATLVLPAYPFDPQSWKTLGTGALREANASVPTVHVDPKLLAKFGVVSPYRADVDANMTVSAGAKSAKITANVRGLAGGRLTAPVDVALLAETGGTGTTASVDASSGKLGVSVVAKSPLTVESALANGVENAALDIVATVPDIAAKDLLGLLGETDVLAGTVGGTFTVRGTVKAPELGAKIVATGFAMKASSITNQKPADLDKLELEARWTREFASVRVTGREGRDRLLEIAASGDPRRPRSVIASIQAANFDLAPLAAFGTGPIRAARGTLNAALAIKGLDPQTGSIRGMLAIKDARYPLSPELGTLRRANLEVDVIRNKLVAKFDGRLGAGGGNINGTITSDFAGGTPMNAVLDMKLKKVSPIGAMQPQIDADITGSWANEGEKWSGSMRVRNGKIYIPPETGSDLLLTGAPSDMIFVDKQTKTRKGRKPPTKTWLTTKIAIGNTDIDVEDADFRVRVVARGNLTVDIGDGLAVYGQIATTRGNVDLVGRRYRVEQAVIDFDNGTLDPRLDIRIVRDFKNLTLTANVRGRSSNPIPDLSADRGNYTEGQLLSFLAGAEPGDDSSTQQANQAVVSGGLAILSGRIGRRVNQYLPVKFDSINYEAATSSSSKAIRFSLKLSERSYIVWRQHVAPRADENTGEAVFEYQFRGNWLFETTIGERNKGGDFLWRKRW